MGSVRTVITAVVIVVGFAASVYGKGLTPRSSQLQEGEGLFAASPPSDPSTS